MYVVLVLKLDSDPTESSIITQIFHSKNRNLWKYNSLENNNKRSRSAKRIMQHFHNFFNGNDTKQKNIHVYSPLSRYVSETQAIPSVYDVTMLDSEFMEHLHLPASNMLWDIPSQFVPFKESILSCTCLSILIQQRDSI